ncbi:hypothetical protein [Sandaracinus amylolyticus]|uniref:Lipoprotein n=1 Tax=Sandaracinus amylolyticus TaxID=927083 RepID=A0A0F6W0Z6_9BACT|nr:hypothetical protein [Sandaracinus amylolyticus]AKF04661.1 hypothetical protein DB32_001810 [Sandaracinus amylolyticus]
MSTRPALLLLGCLLFVASCGARQPRVGPDPVPRGEWCQTVGRTFCNWMIDSCSSGEALWTDGEYSCEDRYVERCVGGGNRFHASGHSYDDLAHCVDLFEQTNCLELGMTHVRADGHGSMDLSRLPRELVSSCELNLSR